MDQISEQLMPTCAWNTFLDMFDELQAAISKKIHESKRKYFNFDRIDAQKYGRN